MVPTDGRAQVFLMRDEPALEKRVVKQLRVRLLRKHVKRSYPMYTHTTTHQNLHIFPVGFPTDQLKADQLKERGLRKVRDSCLMARRAPNLSFPRALVTGLGGLPWSLGTHPAWSEKRHERRDSLFSLRVHCCTSINIEAHSCPGICPVFSKVRAAATIPLSPNSSAYTFVNTPNGVAHTRSTALELKPNLSFRHLLV